MVVDDASKDGTITSLHFDRLSTSSAVNGYLSQMNERLRLIQHETNQGVGGAIATGYKWAALLPFYIGVAP